MIEKRSLPSFAFIFFVMAFTNVTKAERGSLFSLAVQSSEVSALFDFSAPNGQVNLKQKRASLFAGRDGTSLFAPFTVKENKYAREAQLSRHGFQAKSIMALIAQAEAGKNGYDAIQHSASILPKKRPSEMTIQEIYDWIKRTPGQNHAIGRYQFIPVTLERLVLILDVNLDAKFSTDVQDEMANALLVEAGLNAYYSGEVERRKFMNNMAKIWAGLPTSSGKSYYDGFSGNKATMTWAYFDQEMARIFAS